MGLAKGGDAEQVTEGIAHGCHYLSCFAVSRVGLRRPTEARAHDKEARYPLLNIAGVFARQSRAGWDFGLIASTWRNESSAPAHCSRLAWAIPNCNQASA